MVADLPTRRPQPVQRVVNLEVATFIYRSIGSRHWYTQRSTSGAYLWYRVHHIPDAACMAPGRPHGSPTMCPGIAATTRERKAQNEWRICTIADPTYRPRQVQRVVCRPPVHHLPCHRSDEWYSEHAARGRLRIHGLEFAHIPPGWVCYLARWGDL